ncbi:HET-domain-containing protein, partial [Lophiostoma macrostomum CBS 122681]
LPSRVLDVSIRNGSDDMIRLHESVGELAQYACLSYCWGNALPLKTTKDTYEDRRRGIAFGTLPNTFQDAVTVTRRLGIKYLWVDAMCIIQDSRDDWEIESSRMATVYKNAHVAIAADIAKDCNAHFLPRRKSEGSKDEEALAKFTESDGSTFTVYGQSSDGWGHPDPLESNLPLRRRAWTLQEELLASRIVHFTQNELYWEC